MIKYNSQKIDGSSRSHIAAQPFAPSDSNVLHRLTDAVVRKLVASGFAAWNDLAPKLTVFGLKKSFENIFKNEFQGAGWRIALAATLASQSRNAVLRARKRKG